MVNQVGYNDYKIYQFVAIWFLNYAFMRSNNRMEKGSYEYLSEYLSLQNPFFGTFYHLSSTFLACVSFNGFVMYLLFPAYLKPHGY